MKKKLLMMIIAMLAMISIWGCSDSDAPDSGGKAEETDAEDDKEEDTTGEEGAEEDASANTRVEQINLEVYVRHEITKDYNEADAVRIYFTYTNRSDETKTAQLTFYPQVFQNGIECDFTSGDFMEPNEAESNLSKELMKDSSLEVAFIYTLQDVSNPVILKVNDHSADNLFKGIYQEQELVLQ